MKQEAIDWLGELREFAHDRRGELEIPDGHNLGPRENWRRRVTGGVLLQFLDFVQSGEIYEHFGEALDELPLDERAFLFITDLPGAVAAEELIQTDSDHVLYVLKEEWRAWLTDPEADHDDEYEKHYEFWSVWHQDLDSEWELDELEDEQWWVHEEGFALADGAGRGAQHLWKWDGADMEKVEEAITAWSSFPTPE